MEVIRDWKWVLRHGWSIRWIALAALLSGVEIACAVVTAMYDAPPFGIPRGLFAGFSGAATMFAFVARFIAQKRNGAE